MKQTILLLHATINEDKKVRYNVHCKRDYAIFCQFNIKYLFRIAVDLLLLFCDH